MISLIRDGVGRNVAVTLQIGGIGGALTRTGRLLNVDTTGVVIEQPKGQTCVPTNGILHIVLRSDGGPQPAIASRTRRICSAIGRGAFGVFWPWRASTFK